MKDIKNVKSKSKKETLEEMNNFTRIYEGSIPPETDPSKIKTRFDDIDISPRKQDFQVSITYSQFKKAYSKNVSNEDELKILWEQFTETIIDENRLAEIIDMVITIDEDSYDDEYEE